MKNSTIFGHCSFSGYVRNFPLVHPTPFICISGTLITDPPSSYSFYLNNLPSLQQITFQLSGAYCVITIQYKRLTILNYRTASSSFTVQNHSSGNAHFSRDIPRRNTGLSNAFSKPARTAVFSAVKKNK